MSNSVETEPSPTGSLWDRIEPIAKMLPLVLAGLYVLGFIIVAFHLAAFGASSLELVRIQYLAAGFWFSVIVATFEGVTQLWQRLYTQHGLLSAKPFSRTMGIVTVVLAWVTVLWGLPFLSPMSSMKNLLQVVRQMLAPLILMDAVLRVRPLLVRQSGSIEQLRSALARGEVVTNVYSLVAFLSDCFVLFAVSLGMGCIVAFSQSVYPKIPFTFGGGQPRQVVFWLGSNNSDSVLERDSTSKYSVPYDLLLENENSFVVISPKNGQKVIELDRKTVNAVIVLGEKQRHLP